MKTIKGFTAGPWTTENVDSEGNCVYMRINSSKKSIGFQKVMEFAGSYGGSNDKITPEKEAAANAELIAQAPEMYQEIQRLEKLNKELVEALENLMHRTKHGDYIKAEQALKKAKS